MKGQIGKDWSEKVQKLEGAASKLNLKIQSDREMWRAESTTTGGSAQQLVQVQQGLNEK